jgi:hypothetical protein
MPWIRVAIGAGGCALVTGAAGMVVWINNGSHYFELAVALASTGFLTLVACVLTRVFGSSHGSQDDAFRRGRSMGYDAGYVEGHRAGRLLMVPLHSVPRDLDSDVDSDVDNDSEITVRSIHHANKLNPLPTAPVLWRRDTMPLTRRSARERVVGWVVSSRIPLLAGALSLAVVGVLVANALASTPGSAEALLLSPGTEVRQAVQTSGVTPALVSKPDRPGWSVAVEGRLTLSVPGVGGVAPVVPDVAGGSPAVPGAAGASPTVPAGAAAVQPVLAASSVPAVGGVAPSTVHPPEATGPVTAPSSPPAPAVVPVVAAPTVALTAAQQTAADAAQAAATTAAVAAQAASSTAATAKAAADLTAANAAAAAAATAKAAAAAAWAVAH